MQTSGAGFASELSLQNGFRYCRPAAAAAAADAATNDTFN